MLRIPALKYVVYETRSTVIYLLVQRHFTVMGVEYGGRAIQTKWRNHAVLFSGVTYF
jgi:hypothetical protein